MNHAIIARAFEKSGGDFDGIEARCRLSSSEIYGLLEHEYEVDHAVDLDRLICFLSYIGVNLTDLFSSDAKGVQSTGVVREFHNAAVSCFRRSGLEINEFSEKVGWDLAAFISDPKDLGTWSLCQLREVAGVVHVNWFSILSELSKARVLGA